MSEQTCHNCLHEKLDEELPPCRSCGAHDNWQAVTTLDELTQLREALAEAERERERLAGECRATDQRYKGQRDRAEAAEKDARLLREQLVGEKESYALSDKIATKRMYAAEATAVKQREEAKYWKAEFEASNEGTEAIIKAITTAAKERGTLKAENADLLAALQIVKEQRQNWWGKAVERNRQINTLKAECERLVGELSYYREEGFRQGMQRVAEIADMMASQSLRGEKIWIMPDVADSIRAESSTLPRTYEQGAEDAIDNMLSICSDKIKSLSDCAEQSQFIQARLFEVESLAKDIYAMSSRQQQKQSTCECQGYHLGPCTCEEGSVALPTTPKEDK